MKLRNKKTGEVLDSACIGVFKHQSSGDCERVDTEARSLSKFLEQWEDYTPAEPLIKDEKVRKVVRAWAGCCYIPLLKHYFSNGFSCFICKDEEDNEYCLDFTFRINNLAPNHVYTIAELCGEEEE